MMRVMLYEAAQILLVRLAKWSWLKAWAMKIARHRGMKKAIVALARRYRYEHRGLPHAGSSFLFDQRWNESNRGTFASAGNEEGPEMAEKKINLAPLDRYTADRKESELADLETHARLEAGLIGTFPASDLVSATQPALRWSEHIKIADLPL
jgi:hypothetical protein